MTQDTCGSMTTLVKNWIDAAGIDLRDDDACLDVILLASHAVAPGRRAEALEWGAAYVDLLRSDRQRRAARPAPERCEALA